MGTSKKNIADAAARRLEGGGKFWEATVAGATLTIRQGKLGGSSVRRSARTLASPEKALAEREKAIREKLASSDLHEVGAGVPEAKPAKAARPAEPATAKPAMSL